MQLVEFPPKLISLPISPQFQENKNQSNFKYTKLEIVKQF
jgi:hypothetical protein